MEQEMTEERNRTVATGRVLYEIRHHASADLPSDTSPPSVASSSSGGFLSYLSLRGVVHFKERWYQYRRSRAVNKKVSLIVSSGGEHVAVAVGNQISIFHKDDDYMNPCGVYTCDKHVVFHSGVWLETWDILGMIDDLSTLYVIRTNGEEILRRTRSQLKLSAPIIALICFIHIITEDGLVHHIEIAKEPNVSVSQPLAPSGHLHLPYKVTCLDFHQDLSLITVVCGSMSVSSEDNSGSYSLHIIRITANSETELVVSSENCEGKFDSTKGCPNGYSHPKVAISPQGNYVATLDFMGCVDVFKLDVEQRSLSLHSFAAKQQEEKLDIAAHKKKKFFYDIGDITWWTDDILVVVGTTGDIFMYDILNCTKLSENEPMFCMPLIERPKDCQGFIFLLENSLSVDNTLITEEVKHKQENLKPSWSLYSFSRRSASEMYTLLIKSQQYQAALEFASNHCLDTDEVFKAQWLSSSNGIPEINLYLSEIKDLDFVLSECINRVGNTEEIARALLSHGLWVSDQYKFSDFSINDCSSIWNIRMFRLQLLQFRDRLETFMGISMGRFMAHDYSKFRSKPLDEAAVALAESSKIGALNLLFKRHPYSITPNILIILSSIPETVPVESYSQLLPVPSPRTNALRNADWVECEEMLSFLKSLPSRSEKSNEIFTENLLRLSTGYIWPSLSDISSWYRKRAEDIDNLSGQLNNCLSLIQFGCQNGISGLQQLLEDISYLLQNIYSDDYDEEFTMNLVTWEQLPDYEKFKMMLKGVKKEAIVKRLQENAIPFMQNRFNSKASDSADEKKEDNKDSFLVRWLKEVAAENHLDLCLLVIENGHGDSSVGELFKDDIVLIETALHCIYSCTLTNQWSLMASILSKLPRNIQRDSLFASDKNVNPSYPKYDVENSKISFVNYDLEGSISDSFKYVSKLSTFDSWEKRIKLAEGHVEVGRLMAYYQVPKPISFFLSAQSDEKNVKQLLRLILSKFSRRQPVRSDNDWATMWRDLLSFQEKAFPFLDLEYILTEFIRGLLKAGKFSLARNYLKGTASVSLTSGRSENLVIQAAREYFFSASSLSCSEIWKAKECLSLLSSSKAVKAEADMIDALTIRLPNLGVSLLPMQFKQIKNPMEIINMAITSQAGAYLNVEELIEIAKLLGLNSPVDIATVEEAIAREAAIAGDLPLASDLCLVLAKKGHGSICDLCAAIARGPHLDNMDSSSRKQLLGFALSHCDEESIGELLNAWKEVDTNVQSEHLITSSGASSQKLFSSSLLSDGTKEIFDRWDGSNPGKHGLYLNGDEIQYDQIKDLLSKVGTELESENGVCWDTVLRDNKKVLSFAASKLPWLLELSEKEEYGKLSAPWSKFSFRSHVNTRMQALLSILCWMGNDNIAPADDMIKSLAKSLLEPPITEEDDILGCCVLLNLVDAFHGVEIIEEQLKRRTEYEKVYSIMNVGMAYSSLNNAQKKCSNPEQRRKLLLQMFHEKQVSFSSDEREQIDKMQSTFWREWKSKLEDQKRCADQARELEQIIPGIETGRFLSRDMVYIKSVMFSFVDTVKQEKKHILKDAVMLADAYGLHRIEVILHFFACTLVSEHWENNDILAEISEYRNDIVKCAKEVIDIIHKVVYPEIYGHNKERLCYVYSVLSACYSRLKRDRDSLIPTYGDQGHIHTMEPFEFYKVLEQECQRVSFIKDLNFKNIAGLDDLNFEHFNDEICTNICEATVEALADLVQALVAIYDVSHAKELISREGVYKHYVLAILSSLEAQNEAMTDSIEASELYKFLMQIELSYGKCKKYVRALPEADMSYVSRRFCTLCFPHSLRSLPEDPSWKDCLLILLTFWINLVDDIPENSNNVFEEKLFHTDTKIFVRCLIVFKNMLVDDEISVNQGWSTISNYVQDGLLDLLVPDVSAFVKAMVVSGSAFKSIAEACYKVGLFLEIPNQDTAVEYILNLYMNLAEEVLAHLDLELGKPKKLHYLLSSLSRLAVNHTEDLKMVRLEVWERLREFSDNMHLASHTRVYALQLMQCITGINLKSLPAELVSEVEPWEGWDESISTKASNTFGGVDISTSVTTTLVALKSTQLISVISPDIKITSESLTSLDSAVSCFLHLSENATCVEHLSVLQVILEEWEDFFSMQTDRENKIESPKESNNWSNDKWDGGWEELDTTDTKIKGSATVRPLHACWMEIIKGLIGFSELHLVMNLLDISSVKSDTVLLDEDEAHSLLQLVIVMDCIMALKLVLLLPYENPRSQCLYMLESKLKSGSIPNGSSANNHELLAIVLSSGVVRDIATNPSFYKVFSYICYTVGLLAQDSQEDLLNSYGNNESRPKRNESLLFVRVLLPFLISELVPGGQPLIAGFIVSKWMHTHTCLSIIDVVETSLRRYLEQQILQLKSLADHEFGIVEDSSQSLLNTYLNLRTKLHTQLQSALLLLPESDTR
ncbi:MAG2-interacting protein 2-like [Zingiber officinale]|uniref:MAG2-interacting protein 2-like n=1 Tax=Zingiber officinale TaxID=94328 RepID=UPI001C4C2162|nr:MAG2-interacting protein 2-like [Zingiber officinale]